MFEKIALLELLLIISSSFETAVSSFFSKDHRKPHIVLIVVDDLGWNDVSFHGSEQIPTPNIDALASDGIILNSYYVSPICTPSRGSLFTGKYAVNLGLQHYVIVANEPWGLPLEEKTLPQHLKDLGYDTRGIGKWHLGHFSRSHLPTRRGFDSFFGYWTGDKDYFNHFALTNDMFGLDLHDNLNSAWQYNGFYSTELFTEKAKHIIEHHDNRKPLFLYLGYQSVHAGNSYSPLQVPPEYTKNFSCIIDTSRRKFAGMVSAFDLAIGDIFATLNNSRMIENTLIVFTTDNGGAVHGVDGSTGSNWPLRGSKYTMWEGGVRGNAFLWSSHLRNKSRVDNTLFHISDWLPTIFSAVGGNVRNLGNIDGVNQWPSLTGHANAVRDEILHNIDDIWNVSSIRKGSFKLVKGSYRKDLDGWFDKQGKPESSASGKNNETCDSEQKGAHQNVEQSIVTKILKNQIYKNENLRRRVTVDCGERPANYSTNCDPTAHPCLYNIQEDPCEYKNIAASNPKIVEELETLIEIYRRKSVPPGNKPADSRANPKYHDYAWIPWLDGLSN